MSDAKQHEPEPSGRGVAARLFEALQRRPLGWLAAVVVLAGLSLPAILWLELDLSFRPLFSDDATLRATTARLEQKFGDLGSGAIGIMVEGDVLDETVLQRTQALTRQLAAAKSIRAVLAPTTIPLPGRGKDSLVFAPVCPLSPDGTATEATGRACRENVLQLQERFPRATASTLTADNDAMLLWVDVKTPLFNLKKRRADLAFLQEATAEAYASTSVSFRFIGYTVVEDGYETLLKTSAAQAGVLTLLAITLVLAWLFRSLRAIAVALIGVSLGLPMCFAVMALVGWPVTLVSAALPTLLLMVGVADSIHMLNGYVRRREGGQDHRESVRGAFVELLLPCTLTTLTTAAGFGSLLLADLPIIRMFGAASAVGVVFVHLCNLICVPALLLLWPFAPRETERPATSTRLLNWWSTFVVRRPITVVLVGLVAFGGLSAFALRLQSIQYFNRDVAPEHPLRLAQSDAEARFSGFLGPDILVRRLDGAKLTDEESLAALRSLSLGLEKDVDVTRVFATTDYLDLVEGADTDAFPPMLWPMAYESSKSLVELGGLSLHSKTESEAVLLVRTRDIGTERAGLLIERIEKQAKLALSDKFVVEVGGHWVQAQRGMAQLVHDMLISFLGALILVIPFLWFAARRFSLFVVALLPNMIPMTGALGAMMLLGMPLRIGTAIVCAVALGIAVDDTLHLVHALRRASAAEPAGPHRDSTARDESLRLQLREVFGSAGRALVVTSIILVVGFLSLSLAELHVLRDMGRLGALALFLAFVADVIWLPALWVLVRRVAK